MSTSKLTKFDLLIIGSGGAGCAAALEADKSINRILLVTKGSFLDSKTARAQGGIQAAVGCSDSQNMHAQDTLKAGEGVNNMDLVDCLTKRAPATIQWLEGQGVSFDRAGEGYKLQLAAGLSEPRILSCGDASGNRIMAPLTAAISKSNVEVREHTAVVKIDRVNKVFRVVLYNSATLTQLVVDTSALVITAGGAIPRERRAGISGVNSHKIPDSIELAKFLGLEVRNQNLTQFHPTGILLPHAMRRKPVPEVLRSAGATLTNNKGQEFVDPMLTRRKLCDAIIAECENNRCIATDDGRRGVWLNTQEIDKKKGAGYTERNFSSFYRSMLQHDHDITKKPILIYPIAHYSLGGIEIDINCETSVSGVFAAGECTWGIHGNDRLMGNSLLDVFVFGRQAGVFAAKYVTNNFK